MKEVWKNIKGYEGMYQISNKGRVNSLCRETKTNRRDRILKSGIDSQGYKIVVLCKNCICKTTKIHRLVALEFLENKNNLRVVNHKNGKKLDNIITNLEWCTDKENSKHAIKIGLIKRKLTPKQVKEIRKSYNKSQCELAKIFKVDQSYISYIVNNKKRVSCEY